MGTASISGFTSWRRKTFSVLLAVLLALLQLSLLGCGIGRGEGFVSPKYPEVLSRRDVRVGVLEFRGDDEFAPILADNISVRLLNGGLTVVDRSELRLVLEQEGKSLLGDISAVIGVLRNKNRVDVLLTGSLSTQKGNSRIGPGTMTVKLLDVASGDTLLLQSFDVKLQFAGFSAADVADVVTTLLLEKRDERGQ